MADDQQQPHFLVRNFNQHRRQEASLLCSCSICHTGFPSLAKLLGHAKEVHPELRAQDPDSQAWKDFKRAASSKQKQGTTQRTPMEPATASKPELSDDSGSMKPEYGDETQSVPSRPLSAPGPQGATGAKVPEIQTLRLEQDASSQGAVSLRAPRVAGAQNAALGPRKGPTARNLSSQGRKVKSPPAARDDTRDNITRRAKKSGAERLYMPEVDSPAFGHRGQRPVTGPPVMRNAEPPIQEDARGPLEEQDVDLVPDTSKPRAIAESPGHDAESKAYPEETTSRSKAADGITDPEPELLLQPETRPVPYDQLIDEVKGIYAGLVMVEAKCIEVDEKQTLAARNEDPAKTIKLTPDQYSALIALHKTLLNEHHDFFLACQHPSATSAVRRLPLKYSMPARMWRHGIHAFLEVLRFRLPGSLDHMLAFIYIAYSMTALLLETVPLFEDTWIECLGDLGRYRMAVEDDDVRDREIWSNVARSWYRQALDRNPKTGRLNHHLAILARPYTIQQLSYYARALTCAWPFDNARSSALSLFNPVVDARDPHFSRSTSTEILFIRAHGQLFLSKPIQEYQLSVDQLVVQGKFETYIIHLGSTFREGPAAFTAVSCIAALLQFGEINSFGRAKSALRRAFDEERQHIELAAHKEPKKPATIHEEPSKGRDSFSSSSPKDQAIDDWDDGDVQSSVDSIRNAALLAFGIFRIGLRRHFDSNTFPMLHIYFVFLWALCRTQGAMRLVEGLIPWTEINDFLNNLAAETAPGKAALSEEFPAREGERPLYEDFIMCGQVYALSYYPHKFISDAGVDQEEIDLDLPSMIQPRRLRLQWLGHRLALDGRYITVGDLASGRPYVMSKHAKDLQAQNPMPMLKVEDVAMADVEEHGTHTSNTIDKNQTPRPRARTRRDRDVPSARPRTKGLQIMKRESEGDVVMSGTDSMVTKTPNPASPGGGDRAGQDFAQTQYEFKGDVQDKARLRDSSLGDSVAIVGHNDGLSGVQAPEEA